jgi:hypothetical protein
MAVISKTLKEQLTAFLLSEIGAKATDGITYALITSTPKHKEDIADYLKIRDEANKCGFSANQVFRVYKASNGYIFDMDLDTARDMTMKIARSISNNDSNSDVDKQQLSELLGIIKNMPEQRRKRDIVSLSNHLLQQAKAGKWELEVALFSRNKTNKIIINSYYNNEPVEIKYNAYAIRHWDVEIINEKFLIPNGYRVSHIQPCEILPSATGVSFKFTIERFG